MLEKKLWEINELLTENGGPLPMSMAGIYLAIKKGNIPSVRVGRRLFVPDWYVQKLISEPSCPQAI